ncbi:MAG: hypothetical protein ACPGKX_04580 [Flavobacteriaceae bacterium]|tara:strand:- start:1306 stop:1881 length:576 start_codon:yes stop_codon:yes gene_type:complete
MINNFSYRQLLFAGIFLETIIFFIFFYSKQDLGDVFRYSARYSGRLSLIIYLYCFYKFYRAFLNSDNLKRVKDLVFIFGVLHVIHFGFLALSVYLNNLPIIPVKITGGALAYLMIIIYPFIIEKIKKHIYHLIYFYYVGIVMLMTYVARIKGDFEGAEPEIFHKIAFVFLILVFLKFGYIFYIQRKNFKHE